MLLQNFGNVAGNDALGQAFDDGGFADAGFADQYGIILRAAREHLHDAANFFVAADDRIELAAAGLLGEVARIAFERLIFGLGILVSHFLRSADGQPALSESRRKSRHGAARICCAASRFELRDSEQQMLGRNVFVFEI